MNVPIRIAEDRESRAPAAHLLDLVPRAFAAPDCAGCGRHPTVVRATRQDRRAFREISGLTWPRDAITVGFRLAKDRRTLGLPSDAVSVSVGLCPPCSVAYMLTFNQLNQERKDRNASASAEVGHPEKTLGGGR